MSQKFFLILLFFLELKLNSQIDCSELVYRNDSLAVFKTQLFNGECVVLDKKTMIKNYFDKGILDSVIQLNKTGRIKSIESFSCEYSTVKLYYKNGNLKLLMSFKEEKLFGYWREYYKNGQIKYEAEYINNDDFKNNSYYTWNKKGEKFLHEYVEKSRTKKIGKMQMDSNRSGYRKTKVSGT